MMGDGDGWRAVDDDEQQAAGPDDASCIVWAFGMFVLLYSKYLL
jgi:hypothetical protein